jgi:hypothetical protein
MNSTDERLRGLAAKLARDFPQFIERARSYASLVHETLASAPASDFAELRVWLRTARREGLTNDQVAVRLLDDLYATINSAEAADLSQIIGH